MRKKDLTVGGLFALAPANGPIVQWQYDPALTCVQVVDLNVGPGPNGPRCAVQAVPAGTDGPRGDVVVVNCRSVQSTWADQVERAALHGYGRAQLQGEFGPGTVIDGPRRRDDSPQAADASHDLFRVSARWEDVPGRRFLLAVPGAQVLSLRVEAHLHAPAALERARELMGAWQNLSVFAELAVISQPGGGWKIKAAVETISAERMAPLVDLIEPLKASGKLRAEVDCRAVLAGQAAQRSALPRGQGALGALLGVQ